MQVIDDPSGNSYVENVNAPLVDPALTTTHYERNKEQDHLVGIYEEELNEINKEELKEIKEEDEGMMLKNQFLCTIIPFL